MSIPPQLIRVKRKRVDETPVTFLQFDQDSKRHRTGSNWAYQRREVAAQQPRRESKSTQPVIHVSPPDTTPGRNKRKNEANTPIKPAQHGGVASCLPGPRRFRVSKSMSAKGATQAPGSGVSKKNRFGPAVFVESSGRKKAPKLPENLAAGQPTQLENGLHRAERNREGSIEQTRLKRPGVANKSCGTTSQNATPSWAPLPVSLIDRHNQDMDKIANDMNAWVLHELGANLHSMEQDSKPSRFKPKSPAKRFHERHPEPSPPQSSGTAIDITMSDHSDEEGDDDDWVIEEYVRIPAKSVALDAGPADVGILVLGDEEESLLFFGSAIDEDDELDEDDEDENAENYYTADYPEDEVDSGDEYGRDAYLYRHGNNSDEEYDNEYYEEQDEMALEDGVDDDDEARMARIKEFMKRNSAFR
ncbi:Transcription factor Iwr1 [Metarhizium album ARSEF 1941]|uniref:Transcription factor Iwr1 n=1 Tax=Metarhizium album (strain ARSEF 1941) TaxID=1081103 RepID=A0A0B2WRU6_METAS|nr:Transcription factor Iwr1 [Metarhizium album ARSEF 1941]KHN96222.1 Transcription factor Iwr1 [Metarhizium album ARSEF 1941]